MKFAYKIFRSAGDTLLAVSDHSLLGKKFEEDELSLEVNEGFYHENSCDEKGIVDVIKDATIVNAVGEGIVSLMVREKIIDESNVLRIGGVPHAQIVVIR